MLLCPCDSWGRGLGSDGLIMLSASSSGFRILGLMGGLVFRSWGSSLNHKPSTKTSILKPELLCGTCSSLNVGYIPLSSGFLYWVTLRAPFRVHLRAPLFWDPGPSLKSLQRRVDRGPPSRLQYVPCLRGFSVFRCPFDVRVSWLDLNT